MARRASPGLLSAAGRTFLSRPDLQPPVLQVMTRNDPSAGKVFLAPFDLAGSRLRQAERRAVRRVDRRRQRRPVVVPAEQARADDHRSPRPEVPRATCPHVVRGSRPRQLRGRMGDRGHLVQADRACEGRQRVSRRPPRVPAHVARNGADHDLQRAQGRPDVDRRTRGREGGRGDHPGDRRQVREGAARMAQPRRNRPRRDLRAPGRGRRATSTTSTSTRSASTATANSSSRPGTHAPSTSSTARPAP